MSNEEELAVYEFRGIEIEVPRYERDLNFDGYYMIQIGDDLHPTGLAMDGRGNQITFDADELILK